MTYKCVHVYMCLSKYLYYSCSSICVYLQHGNTAAYNTECNICIYVGQCFHVGLYHIIVNFIIIIISISSKISLQLQKSC